MKIKLCIIFAACVCAHPIQQPKQQITKNTLNKNFKKFSIPTVSDIKALEKEIWKATSAGDLRKAVKLQSRLETDVLKAALGVISQSKKDPIRSKRDLRELGVVVRRDKRTVKFLSSVIATGAQTGINLLFQNNKTDRAASENRTLIRIPRQGKPYFFPKKISSKLSRKTDIEISNDIIPPPVPKTVLTVPTSTFDPTDISITSTFISIITDTPLEDNVTQDSRKEEVTPKVPVKTPSTNPNRVPDRDTEGVTGRVPARQEEEEDEDEGGGGLGGLITSFLGSLSTPEGGVDLDAVTGLLGGLSTQNDDGSFDFTGLQDTVGSLFGGTEEGGSNVGLFLGGLLGAVIRGSAGDDAAKGAGRLAGNLFAAILPGLSAYPTPEDEDAKPQEGLDSGGFLKGFLSTVIGGLGGLSNSNSSGGGGGDYGEKPGSGSILQIKFQLFRTVFSILTKILGASSTSKQPPPKYGPTGYGPPPQ